MSNNICRFIASGFGSGLAPRAPGTFGTLGCVLVWWLFNIYSGDLYLTTNFLLFLAVLVLGYYSTKAIVATSADKDPQFIVIDEWAGVLLPLLPLQGTDFVFIIAAFALFRLFDITKPWLVGKAEALPGAAGIMADDLVAGVFSLLILILIKYLVLL